MYDSRERNGDIVFIFRPALAEGASDDVMIPVPSHAAAANEPVMNGNEDQEMRDESIDNAADNVLPDEITRVRCHRQVLLSQSEYFKGFL